MGTGGLVKVISPKGDVQSDHLTKIFCRGEMVSSEMVQMSEEENHKWKRGVEL